MLAFLTWWGIISLFGLAALPLTGRVFAWLPGRGYAFSKAVGLLLVSYLLWLGASAGLLPNTRAGILIALLLTAALSLAVTWRSPRGWQAVRVFWREHGGQILLVEGLFLLSFAGWAVVRAYAPEKILPMYGEKFMEIGFLNGVLNSVHFPPLDPWLAGASISYYYFGYVMMAVLTRLSGVAPTVGFDLYDALLFGLTVTGAYGVVSSLVRAAQGTRRSANGFGLLGALFVTGIGNLEGLLEGLHSSRMLPTAFWGWLDIAGLTNAAQPGTFYPGHGWWWWTASRVLTDLDLSGKPAAYQPIDEFPLFSFLLGDNHPHKMALPFVLLALGLALNLFLRGRPTPPGGARERAGWRARLAGLDWALWGFAALLLGGLAFLNTWDFPVCLGLVVLAYAGGQWLAVAATPRPLEAWGARTRLPGGWTRLVGVSVGLAGAAVVLYGFFYAQFSSQAGGVLPYTLSPTRLPQYLVMFGLFVFGLCVFLLRSTRSFTTPRRALQTWGWLAGLLLAGYGLMLVLAVAVIFLRGLQGSPWINSILGDGGISGGLGAVVLARLRDPWLFLLLTGLLALPLSALRGLARAVENRVVKDDLPVTALVWVFAGVGLALTLSVEFIFLRDNFGMRMNSVFKFYYQAWVLLACASAYAAWWMLTHTRGWTKAAFGAGLGLLTAASLVYPLMGITSRVDGWRYQPTLDAAATFAGTYGAHWAAQPDDWAAIQWLREHGRLPDGRVPTILEAGAGGYENAGRISAFTGYPTLLGWSNHEAQWRGSPQEIQTRTPVIESIYTRTAPGPLLDLLHAWKVDYVIVGGSEREYMKTLCASPARACDASAVLQNFEQTLMRVFTAGETQIYQVPDAPP